MSEVIFNIVPEAETHFAEIETLLDEAFGPGRFAKTAYRLREGVAPISDLGLVGFHEGELVGSIRFWPIRIGTYASALMLGPLVISPKFRGRNLGFELIKQGLAKARTSGSELVILVGDEPYYRRSGFKQVAPGHLTMPGPCDPQRLLFHELIPDVMSSVEGPITREVV